jgi:hypothetical protein
MPEFCAPSLGNKPNVVVVDAEIPANTNGVLYKLGANSGGLTCFVEDGVLSYEYNFFLIQRTKIRAKLKLPVGKVKIEVETAYAVPKPGGPLNITMRVNGQVVATGQVPMEEQSYQTLEAREPEVLSHIPIRLAPLVAPNPFQA